VFERMTWSLLHINSAYVNSMQYSDNRCIPSTADAAVSQRLSFKCAENRPYWSLSYRLSTIQTICICRFEHFCCFDYITFKHV